MDKFDLYRDIATRTGGDVYVGVVGPVRTGKSTFIKQFMEELALDGIVNPDVKKRAVDELPQSADGKTIMTTQPKFVPNEAVKVSFSDNLTVNLRLIDCVGYLVAGALGSEEDGKERMVRTPWSEDEMPFSEAAALGTDKVIREHSTIALAVTTDGSFTDIPRAEYVPAEEKIVAELKKTGKPFAIVLNTVDVSSERAVALRAELEAKYAVPVLLKNVLKLTDDDADEIMESILLEFGVKLIDFKLPRWVQALPPTNSVVKELIASVKALADDVEKMRDYETIDGGFEKAEFWKIPSRIDLDAGKGRIVVEIQPKDDVFFKVASEECGVDIADDFELLCHLRVFAKGRAKTEKILAALEQVDRLGYGIVAPSMEDMQLEEPEIIKQGQQYGVRLKASAPSLHIMKVDVETEVSPIVGTEQQSEELVGGMLGDFEDNKQAIWSTNLFGRPLSSLVADGIANKLTNVPADAELKLKKTLGRIINEGRGGVICILL